MVVERISFVKAKSEIAKNTYLTEEKTKYICVQSDQAGCAIIIYFATRDVGILQHTIRLL